MLITFVVIYLVITFLVGIYTSRLVRGSRDFVQAGRRLPLFLNAADLFALWFGSETIFGASSEFAQHGLKGVVEDPFGAALCLVLFGMFFIRRLYRMNLYTLGDLFKIKYGRTTEITASFFMLLTFFGYIAAQFVALGYIFSYATGGAISIQMASMICAVIVMIYTMVGGMWAVSITDFIQSIVIVIGFILAVIFLLNVTGGFNVVIANAPENTFRFLPDGEPFSIINWLGAWMVVGLGYIPSQDVFQRANAARNEKSAVRSMYIGAGLYILIAMMPLFITLCAKVMYPSNTFEDTQAIILTMITQHTPLWLQIIFFGALLSAVLSTCSGAILAPASILAENFIKPLSKKTYTDKQFLHLLRWSVVIIGCISMSMSLVRTNIFALVAESAILGMVSLLAPVVAGLYSKTATKEGAMLSMFSGIIIYVVFEYVFPVLPIEAFLPATFVSFGFMYAGKYFVPREKRILQNV
ncbi:MAG: sodium:solute symporter family protein [Chitinophagales bacterium]